MQQATLKKIVSSNFEQSEFEKQPRNREKKAVFAAIFFVGVAWPITCKLSILPLDLVETYQKLFFVRPHLQRRRLGEPPKFSLPVDATPPSGRISNWFFFCFSRLTEVHPPAKCRSSRYPRSDPAMYFQYWPTSPMRFQNDCVSISTKAE